VSLPRVCVLDACFVIDWARWGRRDLHWRVFDLGFIPELVLREVSTPQPLRVMREWMTAGLATVYPSSRDLEGEALDLILRARRDPRVPRIDPPEALCAVLARRLKAVVLTENRGLLRAYELAKEEFAPAIVWNSLRLLAHLRAANLAVASSFVELVAEYEGEVKRVFSRREVTRVAEEFGIS